MKKKSILLRLCRGFGLILILGLLGIAAALVFDVPVPLNGFREDIEVQFSEALGREVSISGDIDLVSGLMPSIRLKEVTIGNPPDWKGSGKFATCGSIETTIGIRELVRKEIRINNITISDLHLSLEETAESDNNWVSLTGTGIEEEAPSQPESPGDQSSDVLLGFTGLDFITVTGLSVTHQVAGESLNPLFSVESLMGSAPKGEPVKLAVSGHFRELPFDGTFTGGTLEALLAGAQEWPFDFEIDLHGATADIKGRMSANHFKVPGMLDFSLTVPEVDRLQPLTGPLPLDEPVQLSGKVLREHADRYRFAELKGEVEATTIAGEVSLDLGGELPHFEGRLAFGSVPLETLAKLNGGDPSGVAVSEKTPEPGKPASTSASLFPFTGKLAVAAEELTGIATTARSIDLDLALTETEATAEMAIEFAGDPFSGKFALSRPGAEKPVSLEIDLTGTDAEITEMVRYLTGNDRFTGQFETGRYRVEGTGETLVEAWKRREVDFVVTNAEMTWRSDKKEWQFFVESGSIKRPPNRSGEIIAKGKIGEADADLRAKFHLLEDDIRSRFDEIAGTLADVTFEFTDVSVDDVKAPYRDIQFSIEGDRLNQLDSVYDLDLPPVGPYKASGIFRRQGDEIAVDQMDLSIGDNHLLGNWRLDRAAEPPKLTGALNAETLQIGEFSGGGGWSPIVKSIQTGEAEDAVEKSRRKLLSREILSNYDIDLQLEVGSMMAGSQELGKGALKLALDDADLRIDPLTVDIPGGHFDGSFRFHPKADGTLDWSLRIDAEKADYGILARRINPESTMEGKFNLDLDVGASGVPVNALQLNVASGDLAFNVCPKNIDASGFDIWALSLLRGLLPKFDPDNESKLNCVLGKLHLEDGIITPESLGLDTSTIRVGAEGQIDLKNDTIDLKLTPYPKKPQLFSIEAPVSIRGSLEDPEIGMGKLAGTRTIGRMAKNAVLFPIKALALERLPEDGSDICACAENYNPDPDRDGELVPGRESGNEKSEKEKEPEK